MTKNTLFQVFAVALSLSAAYVSLNLLAKHLKGSSGLAWFDAGCASDQEGGADCDAVMKSKYDLGVGLDPVSGTVNPLERVRTL